MEEHATVPTPSGEHAGSLQQAHAAVEALRRERDFAETLEDVESGTTFTIRPPLGEGT